MTIAITTITESVFGAGDGGATVTPSGGTSPYTYLWDTGETTQAVVDLQTGWHYVTVTDATGNKEVGFAKVTLAEQVYDFNMTDSQLGCFLKIASCGFGDKVSDYFSKTSKGFRDCCSYKELFLLMKNIETAACWSPQSKVSVEDPSYFAMDFASYSGPDCVLTVTVLSTVLTFNFLAINSLAVNLIALVDYINQNSTFKAQLDGNRLWVYAPSGYSGVPVTVASTSGTLVFSVITTNGFQGGALPGGSYVDWMGVYHEAPEDCLDQDQVGNIIDNIKGCVDCKCTSALEILNDVVC